MMNRVSQLSSTQLAAVDSLHEACKRYDGNAIPIYRHLIEKRHPLACNVLYEQDNHLVGYLRAFFFYTNACEIAVMVAPPYRRQGIAKKMLQEIIPILTAEHIVSLIFSTPPGKNEAWLKTLGFRYRNSEYHMEYNPKKETTVTMRSANIRPATLDDIPTMCAIDESCFPHKKADPDALFRSLLNTGNCHLFVLIDGDEIVGKAHLFIESDRVRITDIGVLPKSQGQGFGCALVRHCIHYALIRNKTRITLDVETNNEKALKLYTGLGFDIINTHDYWVSPENATGFGLNFT